MNSTQTAGGGSKRRKSRGEGTKDGWTQGLALRAAMMMYPFSLWHVCSGVYRGPIGGFFLGVVGRGVGQIDLHVIRHFFQEVRGHQATMAIELTLGTKMVSTENKRKKLEEPLTNGQICQRKMPCASLKRKSISHTFVKHLKDCWSFSKSLFYESKVYQKLNYSNVLKCFNRNYTLDFLMQLLL